MVYTQMLFALAFDKVVFNTTPGLWGIAGSSLILGSALYVALQNNHKKKDNITQGQREGTADQTDEIDDMENGVQNQTGPLRGVQEVQLRTIRV